jgi:hypothetical protein
MWKYQRCPSITKEKGEFYFLPFFTLPLYNLPLFTFTSIFYHSLLCFFIICPFDLFLFRLRIRTKLHDITTPRCTRDRIRLVSIFSPLFRTRPDELLPGIDTPLHLGRHRWSLQSPLDLRRYDCTSSVAGEPPPLAASPAWYNHTVAPPDSSFVTRKLQLGCSSKAKSKMAGVGRRTKSE